MEQKCEKEWKFSCGHGTTTSKAGTVASLFPKDVVAARYAPLKDIDFGLDIPSSGRQWRSSTGSLLTAITLWSVMPAI